MKILKIFLLNKIDIKSVPKKWMLVMFIFAVKLHFLWKNIVFWLNSFFSKPSSIARQVARTTSLLRDRLETPTRDATEV
jgi:hypothetical protein